MKKQLIRKGKSVLLREDLRVFEYPDDREVKIHDFKTTAEVEEFMKRDAVAIQKKWDLVMAIADRAWEKMKANYKDKLSLMMDIDATNENCPLKLQELLEAKDADFYHDIIGIHNNLNRQTKKLENCFLPRFAK